MELGTEVCRHHPEEKSRKTLGRSTFLCISKWYHSVGAPCPLCHRTFTHHAVLWRGVRRAWLVCSCESRIGGTQEFIFFSSSSLFSTSFRTPRSSQLLHKSHHRLASVVIALISPCDGCGCESREEAKRPVVQYMYSFTGND